MEKKGMQITYDPVGEKRDLYIILSYLSKWKRFSTKFPVTTSF